MHYILAALKITTGTMKMVSNITPHHILDSSTREETVKQAIPVPEDMGEDEIPENHSCHKTAKATLQSVTHTYPEHLRSQF